MSNPDELQDVSEEDAADYTECETENVKIPTEDDDGWQTEDYESVEEAFNSDCKSESSVAETVKFYSLISTIESHIS